MKELHPPLDGWIEVICGSMYSGKTEELIRRLRRAQIARQRVEIFKPTIDKRYATDQLVSHSLQTIPSRIIKDANEILAFADEAQVIGIDEGQFLGPDLAKVCEDLADSGKRVIVAGLDQDFRLDQPHSHRCRWRRDCRSWPAGSGKDPWDRASAGHPHRRHERGAKARLHHR